MAQQKPAATETAEQKRTRLRGLMNSFGWVNGKFWQYMYGLKACPNDVRSGGIAIETMLIAAAEDLYPGDTEKQRELIENHEVYFNTESILGAFVPGTVLGMEIERACGNEEMTNTVIQGVKTALAGPFAGLGDSIIQGLLIPLLISISIGMSQDGSPLGAIFMVLSYTLICYPLSYYMFRLGMNTGVKGAEKLLSSDLKDRLISAVGVVGLIVVGGVTASVTKVSTILSFDINGASFAVQDYLDQIFPGMLAFLFMLLTYWMLKKKRISPIKVMLILLGISAVGHVIGVF